MHRSKTLNGNNAVYVPNRFSTLHQRDLFKKCISFIELNKIIRIPKLYTSQKF